MIRPPSICGGEFLAAVDREAARGRRVCGLRVPSVISVSDHNVRLDPRPSASPGLVPEGDVPYRVAGWLRVPFDWLEATATRGC